MKGYYQENRERASERQKEYYQKNSKEIRAAVRKYYDENREKVATSRSRYYYKNRERLRKYFKGWMAENREIVRSGTQNYRARQVSQLHPECDEGEIIKLAILADKIEQTTGVRQALDHIIPLHRGGWHHHLNLQVLSHHVNSQKGTNPFWERKGYKSWRDVPESLWPENLVLEYRKRLAK